MKKLVLIPCFILLTFVSVCHAEQNDPLQITEKFFTMIEDNQINEAYDMLFEGSPIPVSKPQEFQVLKAQTASGLPMFGAILSHDKIVVENFGDSIKRLVYVLKSEYAPTTWEFYFYKPKDKWFLATVNFNDQFELLNSKK